MVTDRNRRTPSGNCALIPANIEIARGWKTGIGNDPKRWSILASVAQSKRLNVVAAAWIASYQSVFRRTSGPLMGVRASRPKRGCLSANKGTREARSSRVIAQRRRFRTLHVSPMRRTSGGAAVVVRGWESQPHGEGRQEVSFWTVDTLCLVRLQRIAGNESGNREGSR